MSSLLAFALRRQNASKTSEAAGTVSPPPQVSTATSGETLHSETDEVDDSFVTAVMYSPSRKTVPQTPEGLRPRKSAEELRTEFDIPPHTAPMPCLPPRHPVTSPMVSTSSFYSSTTSGTLVAESPDLSVGRARTAVGALVAQHRPSTRNGIIQERPGELGVLPPRDWLKIANGVLVEEDQADPMPYHRLDDSQDIMTPSRARQSFLSEASPTSTADASSIHASPSTWRVYQQYLDESYERVDQQQQRPQNGLNVSFSSRLALVEDGAMRESQPYNFDPIDLAIDIAGEERDDNHDVRGGHHDISGREYVVAATDHFSNVSGISNSTAPSEKWICGTNDDRSAHSLESARLSHLSSQDYEYGQDAMDSALLQRKAANQRRHKERFLLDLVQRLQEDIAIVADVDEMHYDDENLNGVFLKTPLDRDGLLTGYATENRVRIMNTVAKLLHEIDVAYPEEFYMSPTHIPAIAGPHEDLRQSLTFLHSVVKTAIPETEREEKKITAGASQAGPKPRWTAKSWLRSSLGIESIPESPETVRGGDTSLFSLPSESCDTPHTSNVSMTTTITSRHSPADPLPEPQHASNLRRTVEIAATLLQRLTLACNQLMQLESSSSKESIRAPEEIKRNYLQLMSLPLSDISSLVNAFTQEIPQGCLTRIVSEDDNDDMDHDAGAVPPQTNGALALRREQRQIVEAEVESTVMTCSRTTSSNENISRDLFSPATDDMNSYTRMEEEECEFDGYIEDLRRDIGSYDYEDDDCEREGPEETNNSEDLSHLYGRGATGAFPIIPVQCETIERSPLNKTCVSEV